MFEARTILLLLLLLLLNCLALDAAQHKCEIFSEITAFGIITRCCISGLSLTRENYHIEPVAENLTAITEIELEGTVPILSNGICKNLPNLERFHSICLSVEEIEENAFQECKNLTGLYLSCNHFVKLERNTFKGLTNLKELHIFGGNISLIDLDLTDLQNLSSLYLHAIKIILFPAEILSKQTNLRHLSVDSNNLFDLEIEAITTYLESININGNNFKCSRLKIILDFLKSKNIKADTSHYGRKRSYTPENIDNIVCLTDLQWNSELISGPFEQQALILHETLANFNKKLEKPDEKLDNKIDECQKTQNKRILNVEEKLGENLGLLSKTKDLQECHDEKNLGNFVDLDDTKHQFDTLSQEQELEPLAQEIVALETEQNQNLEQPQISSKDFESLNTKQDKNVSNLEETIQSLTDKLKELNKKIEAQDDQMSKLLENLKIQAKQNELYTNLLQTLTSGMNTLEEKVNTQIGRSCLCLPNYYY